jgi:hypothetical protein
MKTKLFIVFLSFILPVSAQIPTGQFKKYRDCFPIYPYPFSISPDYEKSTEINTSAKALPKDLLQKFVYDQGIKPHAWACGVDWFYAYRSYIQFPEINGFYMLVITGDIKPPCGEATYLLSYDATGKLTDTLLVSAEGFTKMVPGNRKNEEFFTVESVITSDTIHVERIDKVGELIKTGNLRKYRQLISSCTYKLNDMGKFIKIKEIKREDIREYELKN